MNHNNFQPPSFSQLQNPPWRPTCPTPRPLPNYPSNHNHTLGNQQALGSSFFPYHLQQNCEIARAYENLHREFQRFKAHSAETNGNLMVCNRKLQNRNRKLYRDNRKLAEEKRELVEKSQTEVSRLEEANQILNEATVELERKLRVEQENVLKLQKEGHKDLGDQMRTFKSGIGGSDKMSTKVTKLEKESAGLTEKYNKLSERVHLLEQTGKDQDATIQGNVRSLAAQEHKIKIQEQGLRSQKESLVLKAAEVDEKLGVTQQEITRLQRKIKNVIEELLKEKNEQLEKMQQEVNKANETVNKLHEELATVKVKVEAETPMQTPRVIGTGGVGFHQRFLRTKKESELEKELKQKKTELSKTKLEMTNLQRQIDSLKKNLENGTELGENDKETPATAAKHGPPKQGEKGTRVGPRAMAQAEENANDGCSSQKKSRMDKPTQK